jgi:hypothetical protein
MHRWTLLITSFMLVTPAMAEPQSWLVGTWKLVSSIQIENGQTKENFGSHPLGQVMFDANGQFSNIVLRSDLPPFGVNNRTAGTPDENSAVVKGSIAYFGTYTLNGETLNLHIEGGTFPNWDNTDQTRIVHLTGEQFTWDNAASSGGGSSKLVFQRIK